MVFLCVGFWVLDSGFWFLTGALHSPHLIALTDSHRRLFWYAIAALAAIALTRGVFTLGVYLLAIAKGAVDTDVFIYLIVGRGILNGLTPYVDLFESKPPGMFLLSALSLLVSGGAAALRALIVLLLAGATFFPLLGVRSALGKLTGVKRIASILSTLCLGLLFTIYLTERAGAAESEAFGAVAAGGYLLTIGTAESPRRWPRTLVASIFLMLSIGIKEPFLLTMFAAALLLSKSPRHFVRAFILPLVIAVLLGTLILAALGLLLPYLQTYLPAMLLYRAGSDVLNPAFVKALTMRPILLDPLQSSSLPILGGLIALLWSAIPIAKGSVRDGKTVLASLVAGLSGLLTLEVIYILIRQWILSSHGYTEANSNIAEVTLAPGLTTVSIIAFVAAGWFLWRRGLGVPLLLAFAVAYLSGFAIAVSPGYYGNFFGFLFPVFVALAILVLRWAMSTESYPFALGAVCLALVVTLLAMRSATPYAAYLLHRLVERTEDVGTAATLDSMMAACGYERFKNFGLFTRTALARHSPVGPIIDVDLVRYLPKDHPIRSRSSANILRDADLLLLPDDARPEDALRTAATNNGLPIEDLRKTFTVDVPPCTTPHFPIPGFTVMFGRGT